MEKIGKIAIVSLLIGVGLLLLDLLACFIALANMEKIGSTPEWQNMVGGIIVGACFFLGISIVLGLIAAIGKSLE